MVVIPGRNIAILEGEYPLLNSHKGPIQILSAKNQSIYFRGLLIGEYRITEIERDQVILTNLDGETLKLMLELN